MILLYSHFTRNEVKNARNRWKKIAQEMITIVEVTVRKSITVNNGNFQIEIKLPFGLLSQFGHVDQRVTIHFGDNFSSGGVGKGLVYQLTDCKSNWCKSWRNHVISQVVSKSKRQMLSVLSSVPPLPAPPPAQSQPNQVDALLILHHKTQGGFFWFFFSVTSLGCKFISCENSIRGIFVLGEGRSTVLS